MDLLERAYHPELFQKQGTELIDLLTQHLSNLRIDKSQKVIPYASPKDEYDFWRNFLNNGNTETFFSEIIQHSIHLHDPHYMGHQICPPLPITALSNTLSSLLNNGMAIYEMGIASSAIEKIVIEEITKKIGYNKNAGGFLTSGGTLANLTALLTARQMKTSGNVWENGNQKRMAILVSEEAHYCVERAAKIMGLGESGILKVPVNEDYSMNLKALKSLYQDAVHDNIEIIAVVGSAPSTSTGIYDHLDAIGDFCEENQLWFHVDGAHGGAAIFSEKYNYTIKGIDKADSIAIDGHKMLMTPALNTALLYKNGNESHTTFNQKAVYLLENAEQEDWYNIARRTFECTKNMMSIHWFVILKTYGTQLFDDFVTRLYDLGELFAQLIEHKSAFEYALKPNSNIVCFRFFKDEWSLEKTNRINQRIREVILEEGLFYIVNTTLKDTYYLRVTLMNPFTEEKHLKDLLNYIETIGLKIEHEF